MWHDKWVAWGIVFGTIGAGCTAVVGLVAVARMAGRGAVRMWRSIKKVGKLVDQLLGDKEEGRPSMMELLEETMKTGQANAARMDEHEEQWHGAKPNGSVPVPSRGRRG